LQSTAFGAKYATLLPRISSHIQIEGDAVAKKSAVKKNLPEVSKQTAGGIGGAVIGGMIAGPVGAIAGGVAGALIGNASAEGKRPIKRAAASVKSSASTENLANAVAATKNVAKKAASTASSANSEEVGDNKDAEEGR
jgi:hypothetical protein